MGYTTNFKGQLGFKAEPTAKQLAALNAMFGEDCRDHPEWNTQGLYHVDLELNEDFSAIQHDGSEKTYELEKIVNVVLIEMRKQWPDFGFTGSLVAQGEEVEDRWSLVIEEDGLAHRRDVAVIGERIECPHCGEKFIVEA